MPTRMTCIFIHTHTHTHTHITPPHTHTQHYPPHTHRHADLLLTKSIDPNLTILPTPNQLKRKIIIKHKKLTPTEDGQIILEGPPTPTANIPEPTDSNELASFILDISESVKNGYLLMQDPIVKVCVCIMLSLVQAQHN